MFLQDHRGSVALTFAFAALPVTIMAGFGVDYTRASREEVRLQNTLDAAVLAAAKQTDGEEADILSIAARHFTAVWGAPAPVPAFWIEDGAVHGEANLAFDTAFLGLININEIELSAATAATAQARGVELLLVLDVSGSMGGGGKIQALRTAAVELVDAIYGDAETRANVWIGIAPFSGRVNIVNYGASWMTSTSTTTKAGAPKPPGGGTTTPKLCTGNRSSPNVENDAPPSVEKFPPFTGNAKVCPGPVAIALSAAKTPIRNALQALYTGDGTSTQVGMAWGWRMVSPRWKGLWGNPSLPLDYDDTPGKTVVIMTDGENHPDQSGDKFSEAEANARLLRECAAMKAEGITIYTVAFQMKGALTSLYQQCATKPEYHFDAESNIALVEAFGNIGSALNAGDLRLIQ